jgi:hypothetical protein
MSADEPPLGRSRNKEAPSETGGGSGLETDQDNTPEGAAR